MKAAALRRMVRDRDQVGLVDRFDPMCRAIAADYYLPDGEHADLAQEARIGLVKAVRDFRGVPEAFPAFAGLCVRRNVVTAVLAATRKKHQSHIRALSLSSPVRSDPEEEGDGTLADVIPLHGSDPAELALAHEELAQLAQTIHLQLSDLERDAWLATKSAGQSFEEVAEILGVTVKAVDNAIWRASRKFRGMPTRYPSAAGRGRNLCGVAVVEELGACRCGEEFTRRPNDRGRCPACRELVGPEATTGGQGAKTKRSKVSLDRVFSQKSREIADRIQREGGQARDPSPVVTRHDPSIMRDPSSGNGGPPVRAPERVPVTAPPNPPTMVSELSQLGELQEAASGLDRLTLKVRGLARDEIVHRYYLNFGPASYLRVADDLRLERAAVERSVRKLAEFDPPVLERTGRNVADWENAPRLGRHAVEWGIRTTLTEAARGTPERRGDWGSDGAAGIAVDGREEESPPEEEPTAETPPGPLPGDAPWPEPPPVPDPEPGPHTPPKDEGKPPSFDRDAYLEALLHRIRTMPACEEHVFDRVERLVGGE